MHVFREGILFEIFLERQNNICQQFFVLFWSQLSSKETGLELKMKSIFIWRFDLSLEKAIFSILFLYIILNAEGRRLFICLFILSVWRDSAVHLSANIHISVSETVSCSINLVAKNLRNTVFLLWVNMLAKLFMGTSCSCSVNSTFLSICCGYEQWNWQDHQLDLTAAEFREFPVHVKFKKCLVWIQIRPKLYNRKIKSPSFKNPFFFFSFISQWDPGGNSHALHFNYCM